MKKIFLMVASAAVMFTSCSKESDAPGDENKTQLSVKISGVAKVQTKAVETPGQTTAGTIELKNGHIFVIDAQGSVTHSEELNVTQASGVGQTLGDQVSGNSRVYITGNIPAADKSTIVALTSLNAIKNATSLMTTQTDYTEAALANSDGEPTAITVTGSTGTVSVSIKPLISRLELVQVKGGASIVSFKVTGVYVDSYYPSFTYAGGNSGTIFNQQTSTTFTGIGDTGTWEASVIPSVANPQISSDGKIWAYNVAPGGIPRFIIKLQGIKYDNTGSGEVDLGETPHYLTVTSYTGVTAFERGKIYRIGGENGITFTEDELGLTPNPVDVNVTADVDIEEWELTTPTANL